MDLAGSLKRAIEILKLNGAAAAQVGRDPASLPPGLVFVAVAGAAGALGGRGGLGGMIAGSVGSVIACAVGVGILHLVATVLFGAKGDYVALLRAESHAAVLGWAGIVPVVGALAGLWHLPVSVVILQSVYGMAREKAIGTVAVVVGLFLLVGAVFAVFFGALLGGFLMGAMLGH